MLIFAVTRVLCASGLCEQALEEDLNAKITKLEKSIESDKKVLQIKDIKICNNPAAFGNSYCAWIIYEIEDNK
jgi:hypothetical protein